MALKLFLKFFFLLPVWLLRILTFQRSIVINNQILDHQTQAFLGLQSLQLNDLDGAIGISSAQELRDMLIEGLPLSAKPCQPLKLVDHLLSTKFGDLKIREYCPDKCSVSSPILYFHGGGYVFGGIDSHDAWLQFFSAEIGTKIFALDYRLAPENKFPCSLQDANLAIEWLAEELDIKIKDISICGDSAGGHLATSLSTYRAINNFELPSSQCLIYPMTDPACESKSQNDYASGFLLSQKAMIWFWEQLKESNINMSDPTFNLTIDPAVKLPKTLIITAGFDPLSDEGEAYARMLNNSDNDVQQIHYPHLIHGFVNMTSLKAAKDATKDLLEAYKNFLK